jgi:hypothetical protein
MTHFEMIPVKMVASNLGLPSKNQSKI